MTDLELFLLGFLIPILIESLIFATYCVYETIVYRRGHTQRMAEIAKAHKERMAEITKNCNFEKEIYE